MKFVPDLRLRRHGTLQSILHPPSVGFNCSSIDGCRPWETTFSDWFNQMVRPLHPSQQYYLSPLVDLLHKTEDRRRRKQNRGRRAFSETTALRARSKISRGFLGTLKNKKSPSSISPLPFFPSALLSLSHPGPRAHLRRGGFSSSPYVHTYYSNEAANWRQRLLPPMSNALSLRPPTPTPIKSPSTAPQKNMSTSM